MKPKDMTKESSATKETLKSKELEIFPIETWKQMVVILINDLIILRLRQHITQEELAERMGIKQSVISRFEQVGRIPTIEFLSKVANSLGYELGFSLTPRKTLKNSGQKIMKPSGRKTNGV
ncbi:MAG TPA: helix-turn-helix transcriptional regulator [Candidatus Cloacimonadota bacterium]|nr:helix-turn-helix transcriptional regulator [Candidatus Cloacimonadota bacterium]